MKVSSLFLTVLTVYTLPSDSSAFTSNWRSLQGQQYYQVQPQLHLDDHNQPKQLLLGSSTMKSSNLHPQLKQNIHRKTSYFVPSGLSLYRTYYNSTEAATLESPFVTIPNTEQLAVIDSTQLLGKTKVDQNKQVTTLVPSDDTVAPSFVTSNVTGAMLSLVASPELRSEYEQLYMELEQEQIRIDKLRIDQFSAKLERLQTQKQQKDDELSRCNVLWEQERKYLLDLLGNGVTLRKVQEDTMKRELQRNRQKLAAVMDEQGKLEGDIASLEKDMKEIEALKVSESLKAQRLEQAHKELQEQMQETLQQEKMQFQKEKETALKRAETSKLDLQNRIQEQKQELQKEIQDLQKVVKDSEMETKVSERKRQELKQNFQKENSNLSTKVEASDTQATELNRQLQVRIEEKFAGLDTGVGARLKEANAELDSVRYHAALLQIQSEDSFLELQQTGELNAVKLSRFDKQRAHLQKLVQIKWKISTVLEEELTANQQSYKEELQLLNMTLGESDDKTHHSIETWKIRHEKLQDHFLPLIEAKEMVGQERQKELHALFSGEVEWSRNALEETQNVSQGVFQARDDICREYETLKEERAQFRNEWRRLEHMEYIPEVSRCDTRILELKKSCKELENRSRQQELDLLSLENSHRAILKFAWQLTLQRLQNLAWKIGYPFSSFSRRLSWCLHFK